MLVTANYKLSFDALRQELSAHNAWILVVDTRGINVWCAAGKGTFSADEISFQVTHARLTEIVSHRELVLPQLAAPGVASQELKKKCGFSGKFGPIRASDLPHYLANNREADEQMRTVSFSLLDRLILVPVEIALIWKLFTLLTIAMFLLSGIGPNLYSIQTGLSRGTLALAATIIAILTGAMATPVLLPWIPGRQFWLKGAFTGLITGLTFVGFIAPPTNSIETIALCLWIAATSSFMAMNFTGATPFTSLSGVKKEMRRGLPTQCLGATIALVLWFTAPFTG